MPGSKPTTDSATKRWHSNGSRSTSAASTATRVKSLQSVKVLEEVGFSSRDDVHRADVRMRTVSATLQLQNSEPLFHRLVDMAGTSLLLRPLPTFVHEMFYQGFCEAQGLGEVSGEKRLQAIEKLDSHELLARMPPSIPSLPVLDEDFLHASPTFKSAEQWRTRGDPSLPGLHWCKELLVGDCQFDVRPPSRAPV